MPAAGRQTPSAPESSSAPASRSRLVRAAGAVGGLTLVSRVFGYARDAIVSALLGTSDVADAFAAAFQIPNTLRRLASEGNLAAAFVPVFSRVERRRPTELWEFAGRFHTAVAAVVAALTAAGVLTAHWVVPLVYSGYAESPGKIELTITLTRLLFAYAFFISLSAVLMAVLNARDRFAAAAFTPVLLNLSIIAAGFAAWLGGAPRPVFWIVGGVVAGGLAQWLFLVPFARSLGMPFGSPPGLADPDIRAVGSLILPRMLGVGVVQLNILVGQVLASGLGQGAVVSLYYAARIQELTLGIFAVSVATVVLPTLSRQGARGDLDAMRRTLSFSLRSVTAITVPAVVGVMLLRHEIVSVLFERGRFDATSTALTAAALAGYIVGLVSVAIVRIVAPGFYALHDTRTPVLVALAGVVVNLVAALALRGPLGNGGIALANSLAATAGAVLLLILLRQRLGGLGGRALAASGARVGAASAAMGLTVYAVPVPFPSMAGIAGAPALLFQVGVGIVIYGLAMVLLRAPEVAEMRSLLKRDPPDTLKPGAQDDSGGGAGAGT